MSVLPFTVLHLHGDNIVECERTVALIRSALDDLISGVTGPFGTIVCPSYDLHLRGAKSALRLKLYPGFGRWNHDILDLVRQRGGTLREAADVIITGVDDKCETPLLAIEFCGALPAGNQAWQRSGRAFSFGQALIPYLYVAELSGYELGVGRVRKAARLPNPAVPFSYVAFSLTNETPTLPVFVTSPGADEASREAYAGVFAERELFAMLRAVILGNSTDDAIEALRLKALAFVETKAEASKAGATLTPLQWDDGYEAIEAGQPFTDFLATHSSLSWHKITSIPLTPTARQLMTGAAAIAIGLTAKDLPICLVPVQNRETFAALVEKLYKGKLHRDFLAWLRRKDHLTICWVMGFKPRHDDARPDRGLAPLARMLIGYESDLLTVIYGPASPSTWPTLHAKPQKLIESNGLWEAILGVSDAILADSMTDRVQHHGYLRSHWDSPRPRQPVQLVLVKPEPIRIGENDVDTVIHLLLARHCGSHVFEGMCNPPGGDWSGISLQSIDRSLELRWLTLPRVGADEGKRPDHVLQLFHSSPPIILSIESKERATSVETDIGPRLNRYVESLLETPASIERTAASSPWGHSPTSLSAKHFRMASAVAFISDSDAAIDNVKSRVNVDLVFSCVFVDGGSSCKVRLSPTTALGRIIATFIHSTAKAVDGISVTIDAP